MNLDNLVDHLEEQLDELADGRDLVYYPLVCEGACEPCDADCPHLEFGTANMTGKRLVCWSPAVRLCWCCSTLVVSGSKSQQVSRPDRAITTIRITTQHL